MFSERIKEALEREVVGQPNAVQSVVRGVTRLVSGLTPMERSWCVYLLVGPPGTGRTYLVRTLARLLRGSEEPYTVNCNPAGQADPWMSFVQQLTPLFAQQEPATDGMPGRPPRIVVVKDLECAHKELFPILARILESGRVPMPDGRTCRLDNCLVFLASSLCTAEILDAARIGFAGGAPTEEREDEQDTIFRMCREEAEKVFGIELLAQLDQLIVFRRLEEEHLARVLDGHSARMNRWLGRRGVTCDLRPAAKAFLLESGSHRRVLGARELIVAHRRELEFPLADLLLSDQLRNGVHVVVDHEEGAEHLHFTVDEPEELATVAAGAVEIPVG
jgi:ATP-dependent Clp protease ATP-binding subunit ClpA